MKTAQTSGPTPARRVREDATAAAARALAEAEARRRAHPEAKLPPETNGRPGPEPVRYGDWENKGIATDF